MEMLLQQRETLDLGEKQQGIKIVCQEGLCWVTQTCDSRDHFLKSGGSFTIRAKGRVIVTAMEACRIMLVANNKTSKRQTPYGAAYDNSVLKKVCGPC